MPTIADALQREGLIGPRVSCAGCGAVSLASEAEGWKALLGENLALVVFCPSCVLPELRRFLAEHRAARSTAFAGSPN